MRVTLTTAIIAIISMFAIFALRHVRAASTPEVPSAIDGPRTPVLLELFTSEGCSDCPPADALLEKLDRSQPVGGADLVVLSEHVDYWDDIGWRDPYSSHEYSERQSAYAGLFKIQGVYTPQMVVDGRFEFVGSDERRAIAAIEKAAMTPKIPVTVTDVHLDGPGAVRLHVKVGSMPQSSGTAPAELLIATADESDASHVTRGENAGRELKHIAVLRSLTRVGTVSRDREFSRDVRVSVNPGNAGKFRFVAIVQEQSAGRVLGVATARLSN
jgi:hypothetical protein